MPNWSISVISPRRLWSHPPCFGILFATSASFLITVAALSIRFVSSSVKEDIEVENFTSPEPIPSSPLPKDFKLTLVPLNQPATPPVVGSIAAVSAIIFAAVAARFTVSASKLPS